VRSEPMTSRPELDARPITVSDYHRMIEAGILDEDEHVEQLRCSSIPAVSVRVDEIVP
jgi:hypothetical protein